MGKLGIFRRLENLTSVASLTPEELRSYEADVKNTRDTLSQIRTAEERGEKRGEKMTQIRIARNLLASGLDPKFIASQMGLSIAELNVQI